MSFLATILGYISLIFFKIASSSEQGSSCPIYRCGPNHSYHQWCPPQPSWNSHPSLSTLHPCFFFLIALLVTSCWLSASPCCLRGILSQASQLVWIWGLYFMTGKHITAFLGISRFTKHALRIVWLYSIWETWGSVCLRGNSCLLLF
jgi:hypothetical protein